MANETINDQSALTTLATDDQIPVWDTSAAAQKKITFTNFFNADIPMGSGKFFASDKVRALGVSGLRLEDDAGNVAITIVDGGTARFTGPTSITATGVDRVDVGVEAGTPRIVLEDAGLAIWVLDNNAGEFRLSTTGSVRMMLTTAGRLALGNIPGAPTNGYLEVYGGGARVDYDVNTPSFFGRARVGYDGSTSDAASFSHIDFVNNANFALLQLNTGETWINAASTTSLQLAQGGTRRVVMSATQFYPFTDSGMNLGRSGNRWVDVWAANATIQTSDLSDKTQVKDSDLGLAFVRALRPISWVWTDIDKPARTETRTIERPRTHKVKRTKPEHVEADGKLIQRMVEVEVEEPLVERKALHGEDGQPLYTDLPILDPLGNVIGLERVPVEVDQPILETITEEIVIEPALKTTHKRPHYGLSAQEVKAAMTRLGITDFAGYIYDPETDSHALRYGEFIAPIISAIQDLANQIEALKEKHNGK